MKMIEKLKKRIYKTIQDIKTHPFFSRLLKNMAVAFIGESGAAVLGLLTTIAAIKTIGNKSYGILMVAYSYVLIIDTLVNFQSWQGLISFGGKALEEKNYMRLQQVIKIGCIIDFATAVLGTLVSFMLASFVGQVLNWNEDVIIGIYYLSFFILFNFTGTSIGVIRLFDKFKYYSTSRILGGALKLIGVIIACWFLDAGLKGAFIAYLIGDSLGFLYLFIMFVSVIIKDKRISLKGIIECSVKDIWKEFFSFTFWTSMTTSVDIPVQQCDVLILSSISYEVVAVYKVYKQIGQALSKLTIPLNQAVLPQFSLMIARGEAKKCYIYLRQLKNKTLKILIPIALAMTAVSLVGFWYTLDLIYIQYWYVLLLYLLARSFALSYTSIHPLFIAMRQVRKNFIYTLIANMLYLVFAILLVRQIGILGSVIAMFIEYIVIIYLKKATIERLLVSAGPA